MFLSGANYWQAEADHLLDLFARVSSFWYVELSARSERVSTNEKCPSLREYQKSCGELQILPFFSAIRADKVKPLEDLSGPHWHDQCHDHRLSLMTYFQFDHLVLVSMKAASFPSRRKEGTPGSASQYKSRGLAIPEHVPIVHVKRHSSW